MRKLAIWAVAFAAAIFAANYLLPLDWLLWLALGFTVAALLLLLARQRWLLGFLLAASGLAAGFLCFFLHAQFTLVPSLRLSGETVQIQGEVCSYPQLTNHSSRVELRLTGNGLPRGKLLLYAEGTELMDFEPGDRISCTAKLNRADLRYGERYDSYISRGIYLTGNAKSEIKRLEGGNSFRYLPLRVSRILTEKVDLLFPKDTAPFLKSLLLGEKSDLYRDESLYLAMNRAGFLHVVAVSGMHIAFLVGLIQLLLGKGRRSSCLCLALLWFFVLVTGSSPSAVRAAVMQSFLLAAPLVKRENDPASSLAFALFLILLVNPYAAGSVSLQLSFSAMAGILCFSEPLRETISALFPENLARLLRAPISTAAASLAVLAFSVPLMAWHFGAVSLLSPLTNILGLWAVSLSFCGGYLSCLLGFFSTALGSSLAWLVSWPVRWIFLVSRLISSVPFAMLYLRSALPVIWILSVYVLAVLARFSRLRKGLKFLLPFALSLFSLVLLLLLTRQAYRSGEGRISVIDVGQGQCVALMAGEKTVLVDCGGIYTLENAGEEAGAYLISCGRERIDALALTHLHADHCNGVTMLMEMLPVDTLILPADVEDEDGLLPEILSAAEKHHTRVVMIQQDAALTAGAIHARLYMPPAQGTVNERCMMGVFSIGSFDALITGDSSRSMEKQLLAQHTLHDLELLIVGHHGSRYASSEELLGSIGADTAVISVGYNPYGHPTAETLERLQQYGYQVFRTDRDGTVEIVLDHSYG